MNPNDEVAPVGGRQLSKEFPRPRIRPQRFGDVGRQLRDDWSRRVGVVRWCGRETGRREQAGRLEFRPPFPISVRPLARRLSRRNFKSVSVVIETFDKTVNPSEAKRLANHVFVGDRLYPRMGLVEYEPDSWTRGVMLGQPRPPLSATRNLQASEFCRHVEWRPAPGQLRLRDRLAITLGCRFSSTRAHIAFSLETVERCVRLEAHSRKQDDMFQ